MKRAPSQEGALVVYAYIKKSKVRCTLLLIFD